MRQKLNLITLGVDDLERALSFYEKGLGWKKSDKSMDDNYLQALVTAGFEKRIMYGSDEMIWSDALNLSIKNVEDAPFLSEEQKQDIFYNNAAGFFGIE